VNYTREPIIETIITPKEGCKLVVRNTKGVGQEEYFVEALEVVSFGHAVFFRSTERPKAFLLPVTDYEVVELKETRMVLKNVGIERSIKIGGGKVEETKPQKRKRMLKKQKQIKESISVESAKGGDADDETQVSSSVLRKLFPPPPNLIKEKLNHIKSAEKIDEGISEEIITEMQVEKPSEEPTQIKPEEEKKEE
jgi:hypothetical protein